MDTSASSTPSASMPLEGSSKPRSTHNSSTSNDEKRKYAKRLDAIERIRDKVGSKSLPLPQICVIGNQSSGKSTLLSKLIPGLEYVLPQGRQTTTRCPIIIRMKAITDEDTKPHITINGAKYEWSRDGQIEAQKKIMELQQIQTSKGHEDDKNYHDVSSTGNMFDEDSESDQVQEDEKEDDVGFSSEEIKLTVYHHDVNDLELVDLPGLISNAEGESIEIVNSMAKKAIASPMSFILVVHVANDDFKLAPAFKMAKEVDKDGKRTLVVFTKCDNFATDQAKQDFINIMKKNTHKYFGVSCSKGTDKDGIPISDGNESIDCDKHGFSETFPKNYGFRKLFDQRLPPLLSDILKTNIPFLSNDIQDKINEAETILKGIGEVDPRPDDFIQEVVHQITKYNDEYEEKISEMTLKLRQNLVKLGEKEIQLEVMLARVKPSCFSPLRFQGSKEFKSFIVEICDKMIPLAHDFFDESIKKLTEMVYKVSDDKKSVHIGLVNCWNKFKKDLQDKIRDEVRRLEKETKVFIPINSITEDMNFTAFQSSNKQMGYRITQEVEDPKSRIAEDLTRLFRTYYKDMANLFANRVFSINQVIIHDPFNVDFVWNLRGNNEFLERCVDDPETVEKRKETRSLRDALIQCQLELESI